MSKIEEAINKMKAASARMAAATLVSDHALLSAAPGPANLSEWIRTTRRVDLEHGRLQMLGLSPPEDEQRRVATEFRSIKRGLLASLPPRGARGATNGIMVASALPGDGKTFTAFNLALSLAAEKDWRVVLIDGDVAKPGLTRTLGLEDEPGLMNVLADPTMSLADVVLRSTMEGLCVVPAGRRSDEATELLSSARMAQLMTDMQAHAGAGVLFLFDSPPLLLTSEAKALADMVTQVVLVVRAESTPRSAVLQALAAVRQGVPVGLVLNQRMHSMLDNNYAGDYYGEHYTNRESAAR